LIPGFGITGIAGLLLMFAGVVLAMVDLTLPWDVAFELGYLQDAFASAVIRVAIALVAIIVTVIVMGRYFDRTPWPMSW